MRAHDEEMMTHKRSCTCEVISLEDLALAHWLFDSYSRIIDCRTYDFNITSDTRLRKGGHTV